MSARAAKLARQREYYSRNKGIILEKMREHYKANSERICKRVREYEAKRKTPFTTIYALREPGGPIRYIGKTVGRMAARINEHYRHARSGADKTYRSNWLRSLFARGLMPEVVILETCSGDGCLEEIRHIAEAEAKGLPLVNLTIGGDGIIGYKPTAETRAATSRRQKGRRLSEETKAKMSAAQKGVPRGPLSPSHRLKVLAALAKARSPEARAKMAATQKKRMADPAVRARIAAAISKIRTGWRLSEETKRRISAAHKTSPKAIAARAAVSSLRVEQMSAAVRGKKQSSKTIRKRVAARLANKLKRMAVPATSSAADSPQSHHRTACDLPPV